LLLSALCAMRHAISSDLRLIHLLHTSEKGI